MSIKSNFFDQQMFVNAELIRDAVAIAGHMYETGEPEDALVWLLEELDAFLFWTRECALDKCFDLFQEQCTALSSVEPISVSA